MIIKWYNIHFYRYNCEDASCYKDLARLRGVKYYTWQDSEKVVQEDPVRHLKICCNYINQKT